MSVSTRNRSSSARRTARHAHRPQHRQVEGALVLGEVRRHRRGGPRVAVGAEREARQVVHPVRAEQRQRRPAVLPRPAGRLVGVQHDEAGARLESLLAQGPRRAQPGLAGTDHDDVDLARRGWEGHVHGTPASLAGFPDGRLDVQAIVQDRYGAPADVLRLAEVPDPVPGRGEVLVRVHAASVHPDVWHVVAGRPAVLRLMGAGLRRPKVRLPGTDMAGTVAALGPAYGVAARGRGVRRDRAGLRVEARRGVRRVRRGAGRGPPAQARDAVRREQAATVPTAGFIALHNMRAAGPEGPGGGCLSTAPAVESG